MPSRILTLRRPGGCATCGLALDKGAKAFWDPDARLVFCLDDRPVAIPGVDLGVAGRSAQREHDRRVAKRDQVVRARHPVIGGALLAVTGEPQTTRAWASGVKGEFVVGRRLDALTRQGVITLHDRKVPKSRANIDHISIGPSGVFVVDAKFRERGRVEKGGSGSLFKPGPSQLYVGRRNCTDLATKMKSQVQTVASALAGLPEAVDVPITPILAFVNADCGVFASPIEIGGVLVVGPKELDRRIARRGPLPSARRAAIAVRLSNVLRPA
jgi:hypothetical protein